MFLLIKIKLNKINHGVLISLTSFAIIGLFLFYHQSYIILVFYTIDIIFNQYLIIDKYQFLIINTIIIIYLNNHC